MEKPDENLGEKLDSKFSKIKKFSLNIDSLINVDEILKNSSF